MRQIRKVYGTYFGLDKLSFSFANLETSPVLLTLKDIKKASNLFEALRRLRDLSTSLECSVGLRSRDRTILTHRITHLYFELD